MFISLYFSCYILFIMINLVNTVRYTVLFQSYLIPYRNLRYDEIPYLYLTLLSVYLKTVYLKFGIINNAYLYHTLILYTLPYLHFGIPYLNIQNFKQYQNYIYKKIVHILMLTSKIILRKIKIQTK